MKKCPFCAEDIQDEAVKCRFCGSAMPRAAASAPVGGPPPDKHLLQNESVVYRTTLHWAIFLRPAFWFVVGLIVYQTSGLAATFFFFGGIVDVIVKAIQRKFADFSVTNRRIILKVGVLRKRSLELMLSKVEAISVTQSMLGGIFGFGSIVIGGTGGTKEVFAAITAPEEFRRQVQEQIAAQGVGV